VPKDVHITPRMYQKLAAKIAGNRKSDPELPDAAFA